MGRILSAIFSLGWPETVGLIILGATVGAVAGGAGGEGSALQAAACACLGAVILPGVIGAPWSRLAGVGRWLAARRSRLA